jgi:alpha/beta superfamily hydrolase
MGSRRKLVAILACGLLGTACGATSTSTPQVTLADGTATTTSSAAPVAVETDSTTTAAPGFTELDVSLNPTGWEDVTITTEDDVELYGRFWSGGETAVLYAHDFDNPNPGSTGQRPPQSSEVVLPYAAAIADQGVTLLAIDFRGHGLSAGEYDVQASQEDLTAAYQWLADAGYETIVMVGWVGSGTAAVVLDAASDDVDFAGIAMLFSPPQDTGLDADRVLAEIDAPLFFVGSDAGRSASWARRMGAKAANPYDIHVFGGVPSGVQFIDVYGGELAGRIYDFILNV